MDEKAIGRMTAIGMRSDSARMGWAGIDVDVACEHLHVVKRMHASLLLWRCVETHRYSVLVSAQVFIWESCCPFLTSSYPFHRVVAGAWPSLMAFLRFPASGDFFLFIHKSLSKLRTEGSTTTSL